MASSSWFARLFNLLTGLFAAKQSTDQPSALQAELANSASNMSGMQMTPNNSKRESPGRSEPPDYNETPAPVPAPAPPAEPPVMGPPAPPPLPEPWQPYPILPIDAQDMPLWPPERIDVHRFNDLLGDWLGSPVEDMKRLFIKQVVLDDDTTIDVETIKIPGFIGISDQELLEDPQGKQVSGYEDVAKFLARDGLLVCTYQWNKERYGLPIDTRKRLEEDIFKEAFIKNEAHHAGVLIPAQRLNAADARIAAFAAFNEPDTYHSGLYGRDGYVAVVQRLVFPSFVTQAQARGYTDSIICWLALINPFAKFPDDYNGGDPTRIGDRPTLKEFLQNVVLASLEDESALAFFNEEVNKTYCAEFVFVGLNTPLYPFNKPGLMRLLDGDEQKAEQVLLLRDQQNSKQDNILSQRSGNPQFQAFNIQMPVVPEVLPPLDALLAQQGQKVDESSIPFPPFTISQVIRCAFRTLLPRQQLQDNHDLAAAQARLFRSMEPALLEQLGLESAPPNNAQAAGVRQFIELVSQQLEQKFDSYAEFDRVVDGIMAEADQMLVGAGDRVRFVPPRIYVDLGQNDGDDNLPRGWGFGLETVGALVGRGVVGTAANATAGPRVLRLSEPRMRGEQVRQVQAALRQAGITVSVDGIFGPDTEEAVRAFQQQSGMAVDGVVGQKTREQLGLE
ncbi:MAG: peptidoglycan-binding protein [Cyanothece sp. SIO1E1]|nr:peptidoglycan-binding protein [Cyanothece sp. SIO1E1]